MLITGTTAPLGHSSFERDRAWASAAAGGAREPRSPAAPHRAGATLGCVSFADHAADCPVPFSSLEVSGPHLGAPCTVRATLGARSCPHPRPVLPVDPDLGTRASHRLVRIPLRMGGADRKSHRAAATQECQRALNRRPQPAWHQGPALL